MRLDLAEAVVARTDARPIVRMGAAAMGAAFLVFLLWGTTVPIASSVVVQGTLVSDGRNKALQHTMGGRVVAIHAAEGDTVREGDAIVTLDPARSRAELTRLMSRRTLLRTSRERLHAELGLDRATDASSGNRPAWLDSPADDGAFRGLGADTITTAALSMDAAPDATQAALLASEGDVFRSGREALAKEIAALDAKIQTMRQTHEGILARLEASEAVVEMAAREIRRLRPLVDQGYVARNRLADKERGILEGEARLRELEQDAAAMLTSIAEVEHERARVRAADRNASARQLTKITAELAELSDQIVAAREALAQTVLRAPVSGTLAVLATGTVGGVVSAGDTIAEIVPTAADMRIEARVAPQDIAQVAVGQSARLAVTAFAWRGDDPVPARVVHVAADAMLDERTNESYFPVRLAPEPATVADARRVGSWTVGMRADVYVRTGERSFFGYAFEPLTRSFQRSFRER